MSQKYGTPQAQCPPQALRFSHGRGERETRVTGDEPQGIMGRLQTAGEARLARCLLPASFARTFSSRERRLGTKQPQASKASSQDVLFL